MLKWAVSKRAEPIVQFTAVLEKTTQPAGPRQSLVNEIREHRRRSELTKRYRNRNKENHIVASPHPMTLSRNLSSTSTPYVNQTTALRDVGNTTPQRNSLPASNNTTPVRKRNLPLSPVEQRTRLPISFAATLPSIDSAYSPTTPQSGPSIALRGLTVPETYFGSARYIQADDQPSPAKLRKVAVTPLSKKLAQLRFSKVSIQRHAMFNNNIDEEEDLNDMSSKSLDNTDLNVMIDEILQSTRKVKPIPSVPLCTVPPAPHATPNSTILSDIFPASLLMPIDEMVNLACIDNEAESIVQQEPPVGVKQLEVRTPTEDMLDKSVQIEECQFRRQGGVRRKHGRIGRTTCERRDSVQTRQINQMMVDHPFLRQSIDLLASLDTPKQYRWV